jgi:predicted ester cyclase
MLTMSDEAKRVVRNWLANADGGFRDRFDSYIAADYIGHVGGLRMGVEELRRLELAFATAFTGTSREIHDVLAVEDRVVVRLTTRGTHSGVHQGVPPTGRKITMTSIVIYRLRDGRIVESWTDLDALGLYRQIAGLS